MALDQNPTPSTTETARISAIENEIPAYRAISPFAIVSLICGLLSFFSFANWFFLLFAVAAIALGIHADRRIKRDPEIWTGKGFATAGTALGLAFALSAVTITLVQEQMTKRAAAAFAGQYAEVLKSRSLPDAMFFYVNPTAREGKSAAEMYKEIKEQSDAQTMEMRYGTIQKIMQRVSSSSEQDVHFERIETSGFEGISPYAAALFEFHGPASKEFPANQYALMVLKGTQHKGKLRWYIEESRFPYEPASFVPAAKPVDDGHGHGGH